MHTLMPTNMILFLSKTLSKRCIKRIYSIFFYAYTYVFVVYINAFVSLFFVCFKVHAQLLLFGYLLKFFISIFFFFSLAS